MLPFLSWKEILPNGSIYFHLYPVSGFSILHPFQKDLNRIRACVDGFASCYRRLYENDSFDLISWADQAAAYK